MWICRSHQHTFAQRLVWDSQFVRVYIKLPRGKAYGARFAGRARVADGHRHHLQGRFRRLRHQCSTWIGMNGYVSNWRLACHNTVGICMNGYVSNWRLAYHNSQSAILIWIASQILCGSSVPCVKGPTFCDNYRAPLWRLACYLLPLAGCIFFGIFGLVVNSQAPTVDNLGVATELFYFFLRSSLLTTL